MSPHQSSAASIHARHSGPSADKVDQDDLEDAETSQRPSGGKDMTKAPNGWWIFPAILCALVFWVTVLFWLIL